MDTMQMTWITHRERTELEKKSSNQETMGNQLLGSGREREANEGKR